jgi:hypothetical protein
VLADAGARAAPLNDGSLARNLNIRYRVNRNSPRRWAFANIDKFVRNQVAHQKMRQTVPAGYESRTLQEGLPFINAHIGF